MSFILDSRNTVQFQPNEPSGQLSHLWQNRLKDFYRIKRGDVYDSYIQFTFTFIRLPSRCLSPTYGITALAAKSFMTHKRKFCYSFFPPLPHLTFLQRHIRHPCLPTDCTFQVLNAALTARFYESGFLFWNDSNASASQPCYCSAKQRKPASLTQRELHYVCKDLTLEHLSSWKVF